MRTRFYSDQAAVAANQNVKEKRFWLETLAGEWQTSHFPYDGTARGEAANGFPSLAKETFRFPDSLFQAAMKASAGIDLKLHMILVAGLAGLLEQYTASGDIVIGSPILKQEREAEFINTLLVFRTRLSRRMTFRELLVQVKETIITATRHQNFPLEVLPDLLNRPVSVDPREFPLFDTVLLLENLHDRAYLKGITPAMLFSLQRHRLSIEGRLEYRPLLYRQGTVQQIIRHYTRFLEQGLANLQGVLSNIDILSPQEKSRLIKEFNGKSRDFPRDKTVPQWFEDQVEKTPENPAVVEGSAEGLSPGTPGTSAAATNAGNPDSAGYPGNERSLRYSQLNSTANRWARRLQALGVTAETIVAIMVERSAAMIAAVLAVLKAGGAYLPIDPDYPGERIEFMLNNSGTPLLITQRHLRANRNIRFHGRVLELEDEPRQHLDDHNLPPVSNPGDLAYVIYTSGSTGKPKGVMVEHRHFVNIALGWQREYRLQAMEVNLLQMASFSFDVFAGDLARTFFNGGKLVITPAKALSPEILYGLILRHRVTLLESTPSYIVPLMEYIDENNLETGHLHLLILGSDTCALRHFQWLRRRFGRQMRIVNSYGVTEATIDSSYYEEEPGAEPLANGNVPIGKPLPHVKFYVLDPERKLLPPGVPGELYIGGASVSRGYLSGVEFTGQRFLADPFLPGQRMYRTGDRARWLASGNLEFLGRLDSQVKIRGYRIELGEIESQLLTHADIKEAVVVEKSEENGDKYLCGYIMAERRIEAAELREYLGQRLPDYMVPWFFVQLEQWPLTPNGKIHRKALPEPAAHEEQAYVAPRNPGETGLVQIWSRILGTEPETMGIDTNFFDLGGNSLKAIIISTKIHQHFDAKVTLVDIFKLQTIRKVAEFIGTAGQESYTAIEAAEKKEVYPLSSAQKRLYLLQQLDPDSTGYNMPFSLPMPGQPEKEKLEKTFAKLIQRHEMLRTSFVMMNDEPLQRVHREVAFSVTCHEAAEARAKELIKSFVRPFAPDRAPLLRVALITVKETGSAVLMLDLHHIISDGVSQSLLIWDFAGLERGEALPPLRLQYKEYSQWQNRAYRQGAFQSQQNYWLKEFSGELHLLNLPLDFPRSSNLGYEGDFVKYTVSPEKTAALKEMAAQSGGTLQMIMLTIFTILLAKVSGQEDIVVGVPSSGRHHPDLEQVVGIFVNTLALRNFPAAGKGFREFFLEAKEKSTQAYANQDYPLEDLVGRVWQKRDQVRNPLFDVMFEVQTVAGTGPAPEKSGSFQLEDRISKMDIDWFGIETQNQVFFTVYYRTALFRQETIAKLIRRYREIVDQVLENPGIKIRDIVISHDFVAAQSLATHVDHGEFEF